MRLTRNTTRRKRAEDCEEKGELDSPSADRVPVTPRCLLLAYVAIKKNTHKKGDVEVTLVKDALPRTNVCRGRILPFRLRSHSRKARRSSHMQAAIFGKRNDERDRPGGGLGLLQSVLCGGQSLVPAGEADQSPLPLLQQLLLFERDQRHLVRGLTEHAVSLAFVS